MSSMALNALEKEHPCEYLVGDLVWVHIRGSPLWPSMISYDPSIGVYSKLSCECYCKVLVRLFLSCLALLLNLFPISINYVVYGDVYLFDLLYCDNMKQARFYVVDKCARNASLICSFSLLDI